MNCIKIKPTDIIRFLIGQFDLIMSQIKVLLCLRINLGPIEGFNLVQGLNYTLNESN
jgi:hypothetical protein